MKDEKIEKFLVKLADQLAASSSELKRLLEVKEEEKISSRILELEKDNFRIDSLGWKQSTNSQDITFLENPRGDVCEYTGGLPDELVGQQLFTQGAAVRETEKVSKKIPTDEEFGRFLKKDFGKIIYAGHRNTNGSFYDYSLITYFWSSTIWNSNTQRCYLFSKNSRVYRDDSNQVSGYSVRCLV